MDAIQDSTNQNNLTEVTKPLVELTDLNRLQMELLAHQACGGLFVDEDNKTGKMTVEELAGRLGVTRDALYKAKSLIPDDDWQRLRRDMRQKIWSESRITKVWNGVFARGAKGDYQQALLFLTNWSKEKIVIPAQKVEAEVGDNLADLLLLAQKRAREHNIDEAKIIDATNDQA